MTSSLDKERPDLCYGVATDDTVEHILKRIEERWEEVKDGGYEMIDAVADVLRGEDLAMHLYPDQPRPDRTITYRGQ